MTAILGDRSVRADEKPVLMLEDARFDVADGDAAPIPDALRIRGAIRSKESIPKVPKVFLANDCIFNCAYCACRCGNEEKRRYICTPRELAELSVRQALHNRHGIFISSAIYRTPDYTVELIVETLRLIREAHGYGGYIHAKIMPGTDPALIYAAGRLANRLSVNIEVAHSGTYRRVAKNKNRQNILSPMGQISEMIEASRSERGRWSPAFASSQTTQLMAGSGDEDDRTILRLSGALYHKYRLSRVYYTAFHYEHRAAGYEELPTTVTPPWRMQRLYQADRLMQLYGFSADELTPEDAAYLRREIDPKAVWALRNIHLFPIEINTADYEQLLRIPGIGIVYARRILAVRRCGAVTHDTLRKLGVSLKRSRHFITCGGKFEGAESDPVVLHRMLTDPPCADGEQLMMGDFC